MKVIFILILTKIPGFDWSKLLRDVRSHLSLHITQKRIWLNFIYRHRTRLEREEKEDREVKVLGDYKSYMSKFRRLHSFIKLLL